MLLYPLIPIIVFQMKAIFKPMRKFLKRFLTRNPYFIPVVEVVLIFLLAYAGIILALIYLT
jgi:hypothetical protein